MEIRDPIHGAIEISAAEQQIVDSYAFQRLRLIKQLGFAEFSFPGATHNRFLHSIGVMHVAGLAFDQIFRRYPFRTAARRDQLRQAARLAALLHDVGHGPLSHASEEVMPTVQELQITAYERRTAHGDQDASRRANHEDYTIKFLTDSSLTAILKGSFSDISPLHIASLIDTSLEPSDDFFIEGDDDFRPILSQMVSSELDVDRMDYLERDAYYCGTNYGRVELNWLLRNLTFHRAPGAPKSPLLLALNRRALYSFDDFLLSRHHMHLMVYFHHKAIVYEEMLLRYLTSPDCSFFLPADIEQYIACTDYALYQHLRQVQNPWARRITERRPFRVLFELHSTAATPRLEIMRERLEGKGVGTIFSSSTARLSKYHSGSLAEKAHAIFVVDEYDQLAEPYPIERSTEIFQKYEEIRRIERIYVDPEAFERAKQFILDERL